MKRNLRARQAVSSALSTPSALSTFPSAVVASACSEEATPSTFTQTSTSTNISTYTITVQSTTTITLSRQTTVKTNTITSGVSTTFSSTVTATTTVTSTTTITYASGAPSVSPNYLSISPDPNTGAAWALSDSATHMTDNYFDQSQREVFGLTASNQLYSVTNNAYYGISADATAGSSNNKLFWSTQSQYGNKTFSGKALTDGTGRTQVGLNNATTGVPYFFCIANIASADDNTATGYHVYFYSVPFSVGLCINTTLYLSPISNG